MRVGASAIDSTTGEVTVAGAIDREASATQNIIVRATSSDGSSSTQAFAIAVTDVDEFNVTALVDSNTATNTVAENAVNGTAVGVTLFASDADATNNAVTYSLTIDAGGRFAIDPTTGVVTVADATLLDREEVPSYLIAALAMSADGSSAAQNVTINVSDFDEFDISPVTDSNGAA